MSAAVGTAATIQFRFLGSAVAISVITAVGNSRVKDSLNGVLTPVQLQNLFGSLETIRELPANLQTLVRGDFLLAFNLEMKIVLGFAVASVFTGLLMWERKQIRVP